MSAAYQFAIDRPRAFILAGCFVAAAVLLFFAGALSGMLYSNVREASTPSVVPMPVAKAPKIPAVKVPEIQAGQSTAPPAPSAPVADAAASTPAGNAAPTASVAAASSTAAGATSAPGPAASPASASTSVKPAEPSASPPAAAASTAAAKPAGSPPATATAGAAAKPAVPGKPSPVIAETSYAIPLAVRVGSFSVKSNAETLMQSLRDMGYQPAMNQYTDARGRGWYVVKLGPYTRWNAASRVAARVSIAENVSPTIGPMQ